MEDVIHPLAPSGEVRVEGEEKRAARSAIAFKGNATPCKTKNFDLKLRFQAETS
jgi:hypothetical protein